MTTAASAMRGPASGSVRAAKAPTAMGAPASHGARPARAARSVEPFATTSGVEAFARLHSIASSEVTAVVAADECAAPIVIARSGPAVGAMIEVIVVVSFLVVSMVPVMVVVIE